MRLPIDTPLGQGWSANPQIYDDLGMRGHNGWDFPARYGTKVVSPEDGYIYRTGYDPQGYGHYIIIKGKSGYYHILAHLSKIHTYGGYVKEGQQVGNVGSSGFSTGPHLHWGVRPPNYNESNGYYGYVNPQTWLNLAKTKPKGKDTMNGRNASTWYYWWLKDLRRRITGNPKITFDDLRKHHSKYTTEAEVVNAFIGTPEWESGVHELYERFYGRKATASELAQKARARVWYEQLEDELADSIVKAYNKGK